MTVDTPQSISDPAAVFVCTSMALPPWALMWSLAIGVFLICKWTTWIAMVHRGGQAVMARSIAYLFFWPGMDARTFFQRNDHVSVATQVQRLWAAGKIVLGLLLTWGAARWLIPVHTVTAGWTAMVGMVLILHFGVFELLALTWQRAGITAAPIMYKSLAATSLASFWAERWNRGFHALAHRFVFRPLYRSIGAPAAMLAVFAASGLVHELVISVPAGGGWGGPTGYFLIQWAGLCLERSRWGRRLGLRRGAAGWVFTMAVVTAPLGLLFHKPFINVVIIPFIQAIGAA